MSSTRSFFSEISPHRHTLQHVADMSPTFPTKSVHTCTDNSKIDFMALTMINPASCWFEIVELPIFSWLHKQTVNDETSDCIAKLVNKTWLCRYPQCCHLIHDNRSESKLHFEYLCKSYGIKRKPTMAKNPQANAVLECMHQVLGQMLHTTEIDMA